MKRSLFLAPLILFTGFSLAIAQTKTALPSLEQALASQEDVWGLAAMRETNGPSYEFFESLLPPLRYVNAAFRHYPIILSAPNAPVKARLVSNGSAINALPGEIATWTANGAPVIFRVGAENEMFGTNLTQLRGPFYEQGYLPIVRLSYTNGSAVYEQESFASTETSLAQHGVVLVQFKIKNAKGGGKISAQIDPRISAQVSEGAVRNTNGAALVWFGKGWNWNAAEKSLETFARGKTVTLAIATKPLPKTIHLENPALSFDQHRKEAIAVWKNLLGRGMNVEVPEERVNHAWRSLLIQNYALVNGDEPRCSSGNLYDRFWVAESGDTTRAFMIWGFAADTKRMMPHLFNYTRDALGFHNSGFKLQMLAHYYWLTRDEKILDEFRALWSKDVNKIVEGREAQHGLAPREDYAGDISTKVFSLNASSAGWRGLRDISAILRNAGESVEAEKFGMVAREFRQKILAAADKSIFTNTQPPFVPIALFGEDKPPEPITGTMLGAYWNLLAPYVLESEVFGRRSPQERWMLDYIQDKGGLCMGMIRFHQHSGLFANEDALDDMYGLRYVTTLLRHDEVDRALVSFYGKLAQGMTRDTFVGAEGTGLKPLDEFGRAMYLPPNTYANSHFLFTLRNLLVQDFDSDDDGEPETLRLLFATPKRWLEDGKEIKIENAPTAFGEISVRVKSQLRKGKVIAEISAPQRSSPNKTLLRIRLPDGYKIVSARSGSHVLSVDEKGTIDISALGKQFTVALKTGRL